MMKCKIKRATVLLDRPSCSYRSEIRKHNFRDNTQQIDETLERYRFTHSGLAERLG